MMLQSRYDPVTKKIVFGAAAGPQSALPIADPSNQIPAVSPEAAAQPAVPNAVADFGIPPAAPAGDGSGFSTPLAPPPARLQGMAPLPGQPSASSAPMQLPTPAAAPAAAAGPAAAPAAAAGPVIRQRGRSADVELPQISATIPQAPAPAAGAGQAMPGGFNSGGGMMRKPLGALYQDLERERGLPEGYLARTRAIESSNGTRLANPNSSARGDFQFIRSTAKQFGIDPMDPYQSARAAADMAAQNMKTMRAKGIEPDGADLYAAHQQGIGGYLKLRSGQTTGDAAMRLNGGAGLSASDMLAKWRTSFNNAKPGNLGEGFTPAPSADANRGQGPTVAAAQAQGGVQSQTPSGVPAVADNTYKGGILGLFGMGDQSKPGMNKDFSGKMGDMLAQPGGGAVGGMAQAIAAMMGGGGAKAPAPVNFGPAPEDHRPDVSLMALLDPKRRRQGGV